MSSLNYVTYTSQIAAITVISSNDANFQTVLPGAIDYSEDRIYRDLDLLGTRIATTATPASSGNRTYTLTAGSSFFVVEGINVITPVGTTTVNGTRVALQFVSRDIVDNFYPSNASITGVPVYAARVDNSTMIFGPAPDAAYMVEVIGTQRPNPLSAANSSTILTQMVPELFVAASMVYFSGYMRNFGAQQDNPQMAQSWEAQYGLLKQSAQVEELRKMYRAEGWTPMAPSPIATPPRV